jgi:hypothetical protein
METQMELLMLQDATPEASSYARVFSLLLGSVTLVEVLVNVVFAVGVLGHGRTRKTLFAGSRMWAIATLVGGPMVAALYWLMHCSSLAKPDDGSS